MPVTIPPGEACSITVSARMPKQAGLFTRKMGLLVDDDGLRRVTFRVMGRIKKEPAGSPLAHNGQ